MQIYMDLTKRIEEAYDAIMFVSLIESILPSKQQKNSITSPFQQDQLVGKFFEVPG